jgi:HEAT repeat protein
MKISGTVLPALFLLAACAGPRARTSQSAQKVPSATEVSAGLTSRNASERYRAAGDYFALSEADQQSVFGSLYDRLISIEGELFPGAAEALATLGQPVVRKLMSCFEGANELVRYRVAWTLSQMPSEAGEAEYLMKAALRDSSLHVRHSAAIFLGRRHSNPDDLTLDSLIGALNNKDEPRFRLEALRALANAYPPKPTALPQVIRALKDSDSWVRDAAYRTLQKWVVAIDGQEALESEVNSVDPEIRAAAAILLAQTLDDRKMDEDGVRLGLASQSPLIRSEAKRLLSASGVHQP